MYCWVFRPDGALLVQRRSPVKKMGPGQLDLSVAEHLQPGESYLQVGQGGLELVRWWCASCARLHAGCRGLGSTDCMAIPAA